MISYCDSQSNLSLPWVNEGLSHCFLTTVTSSALAGIVLLFGGIQIYFYRKYATQIEYDQWQSVHSKRLYYLQIAFIFLVTLEPIAQVILRVTLLGDKHLYG